MGSALVQIIMACLQTGDNWQAIIWSNDGPDCRYICIIQPQWVNILSFQCGSFNSCSFNILTDRTAVFSSSLTMYKQVKEKYPYINSVTEPHTVYPKKYAHGFCFTVLCCGYTLTDFPKSIRLTSLALWQSNDCPSASKATLMNMDKYFMWIHYERLHNHNKAKHNKTVCIFLGIYCIQIFTKVWELDCCVTFGLFISPGFNYASLMISPGLNLASVFISPGLNLASALGKRS